MSGRKYDEREEHATHCPNCASNFCRKFYFDQHIPSRSDMVLRWAAAVILKEKEVSRYWGNLMPANNLREWMYETIKVFRNHSTGLGKYVSHFGTTRMGFKAAANAMYQGQGKQITVDRHQVVGPDGKTTDYYQFSFDHGNRMYSDYMRMMFTAGEIIHITGHDDPGPREELLGDCIEICLGILRVALMYEGCGVDLFGWGSVVEILTGLERSLLVFNASAYPSGLKNRKIGSSNKKNKRSYTNEDCLIVPADGVRMVKCPIVINDVAEQEDVEMVDATEVDKAAEGTGFSAAAPSTEGAPNDSCVASGEEASKRRRLTPQDQLQGLFENAMSSITQIITSNDVCANCFSTTRKIEDCPIVTKHLHGSAGSLVFVMAWKQGTPRSTPKPMIFPFLPPEIQFKIPKWKKAKMKRPKRKNNNPNRSQGSFRSIKKPSLCKKSSVKGTFGASKLGGKIQPKWDLGHKTNYSIYCINPSLIPVISHKENTNPDLISRKCRSMSIGQKKWHTASRTIRIQDGQLR